MYVLACPRDAASYLLVLEACQLLLVSGSTQLYSNSSAAPPGAHPLLEVAMQQPAMAALLAGALLRLVVARQQVPAGLALYRAPDAAAAGKSAVGRLVSSAAGEALQYSTRTHRHCPQACQTNVTTISKHEASLKGVAQSSRDRVTCSTPDTIRNLAPPAPVYCWRPGQQYDFASHGRHHLVLLLAAA
jgi:hypothetical protein